MWVKTKALVIGVCQQNNSDLEIKEMQVSYIKIFKKNDNIVAIFMPNIA